MIRDRMDIWLILIYILISMSPSVHHLKWHVGWNVNLHPAYHANHLCKITAETDDNRYTTTPPPLMYPVFRNIFLSCCFPTTTKTYWSHLRVYLWGFRLQNKTVSLYLSSLWMHGPFKTSQFIICLYSVSVSFEIHVLMIYQLITVPWFKDGLP